MEKIALVTGASQGIGQEIALRLSASGVQVWVYYSRSDWHSRPLKRAALTAVLKRVY